jgi:hypothetical protein
MVRWKCCSIAYGETRIQTYAELKIPCLGSSRTSRLGVVWVKQVGLWPHSTCEVMMVPHVYHNS